MSLRDLADLTNVSNPYLSQIERGLHEPSVRVLKAISDALNVSIETLPGPRRPGLGAGGGGCRGAGPGHGGGHRRRPRPDRRAAQLAAGRLPQLRRSPAHVGGRRRLTRRVGACAQRRAGQAVTPDAPSTRVSRRLAGPLGTQRPTRRQLPKGRLTRGEVVSRCRRRPPGGSLDLAVRAERSEAARPATRGCRRRPPGRAGRSKGQEACARSHACNCKQTVAMPRNAWFT